MSVPSRVRSTASCAGGDGGPRRRGPTSPADEQPLRAELFSVSQLEEHAKSLAGWHEVGRRRAGSGPDRLLPRLRANERVLREAYEVVTDAVKRGPADHAGGRVVPRQLPPDRGADPHRPAAPAARVQPGAAAAGERPVGRATRGCTRIALELISHADGRVDGDSLRAFVAAYQSVRPLRLGELWAIPIMLRLALLENLRRVAFHVMTARRERERAELLGRADARGRRRRRPAQVVLVLADMVRENPPLTNAFVAEFASRLQGQGPALVFAVTWLEQRLAEQGQTIEQVFQQASQNQAAHQVSIGNSIGSLRFLGAADWRDFVEAMSVVEHALRADPAGVYPAMDFATRDHYRHAVEQIAKREPAVRGRGRPQGGRAGRRCRRPTVDGADGDAGATAPRRRTSATTWSTAAAGRSSGRPACGRRSGMLRPPGGRRFPLAGVPRPDRAAHRGRRPALVLWWAAHGSGVGVGAGRCSASSLASRRASSPSRSSTGSRCCSSSRGSCRGWTSPTASRPSTGPSWPCRRCSRTPREVDDLLEALEVRFLANRDENLVVRPADRLPRRGRRDDAGRRRPAASGPSTGSRRSTPGTAADGDDPATAPTATAARRSATPHPHGGEPPARAASSCSTAPAGGTPREGVWMGWERKRGKLEQFNAALRGDRVGVRHGRRPGRPPARGAVRHHARQRHPAPARRGRAARRHAGPPAEPPVLRRAAAAG